MSILTFPWGPSSKVFCHGKTVIQFDWHCHRKTVNQKTQENTFVIHTRLLPTSTGDVVSKHKGAAQTSMLLPWIHIRVFSFHQKHISQSQKLCVKWKHIPQYSSYVRVLLSHFKGCCMLLYIHDHLCTFLLVMICLCPNTFIVGMKYPECQVTMPPFAGLVVLDNLGCQISDRGNHRIWSCWVSHSIHSTPISHI